jgi:hypothetical protein
MRQGRLQTDALITRRAPADEALGVFGTLARRSEEQLGVIMRRQ